MTEQVLNEFQEKQGWSDRTALDLALTYIENQSDPGTWRDYLSEVAVVDDVIEALPPVTVRGGRL
jgi:hypothetical protein